MNWKNTAAGYGTLSIALHWLMLILIVLAYATMDLEGIYPKGSAGRDTMAVWHYMLGLSVFFLVWVRLLMDLSGTTPLIDPPLPAWQIMLARIVQWALYGLMIGLPLSGWLTLNAKGEPVPFFGAELPALIGKSRDIARTLEDLHESIATAGYFLIGAHAAAALFHHYVRRDNALKLMLPGR